MVEPGGTQPPLTVIQIGYLPPPHGGIATHVQRLHQRLLEAGVESRVWDYQAPRPLGDPRARSVRLRSMPALLAGRLGRPTVFHFHGTLPGLLFPVAVLARLSRRAQVIWALHNSRFDSEIRALPLLARLAALRLPRRLVLVVDNPGNIERARSLGWTQRVEMIPEHIACPRAELDLALPAALETFLRGRSPVLAATLTAPVLMNGVDLYGLDLLADLAGRLAADFPRLGMVITVLRPGEGDRAHYERMKAELRGAGLRDTVYLQESPLPSSLPLLRRADVILRPTLSDGNSMLVNEGLELGKVVVASDCAPRPEGCLLFRSRDAADFERAARLALDPAAARPRPAPPEDQFPRFLALYQDLAKRMRS